MPLHPQATWEQGFIRDVDGNGIAHLHAAPAPYVKQLGSVLNDTSVVPVYGMSSIGIIPLGVNTPTFAYEVSFDGGANWAPQAVWFPNSLSLATTGFGITGFNGFTDLPPGCTHFRARVSIVGAGDNTLVLSPSASTYRANQLTQLTAGSTLALSAGGARIGIVSPVSQAAFFDETSTPLGGGGTATGAARDLAGIASGGSITGTASGFKEFRAQAMADVAGTVAVEVSPDAVTWWRIASVALAAVGSVFYAQLVHLPVTRWARTAFVNGAGAQSAFLLSTARLAD